MLVFNTIIFILFPILSLPFQLIGFLGNEKTKNKKIYGIYIAVIMGIIAFYIVPGEGLDLYRYYEIIEQMKNLSMKNFLNEYLIRPELLINFCFWGVSKIGIKELITFITTTCIYAIVNYIYIDYLDKKNKQNTLSNIFIYIFIITILNFLHVASKIRNILAIAIYSLIVYMEFYKNKKNIFIKLAYIIPVLIHQSLILGIILRLMYNIDFTTNKKNRKILGIICIIILVSPNLILLAGGFFSKIPGLYQVTSKINTYMINNVVASQTYYFFRIINLLIYIITINYTIKYQKGKNKLYDAMIVNTYIVTSLVIYYDILDRFIHMLIFLNTCVLIDFIYIKNKNIIKEIILILSVIVLAGFFNLQFSILKPVNFGELNNNIANNIFSIFIKNKSYIK